MSGLRLAGAVAVLPSIKPHKLQSSREIHMKALTELQNASALRARPDVVYGTMIPDPDYSDDESESRGGDAPHSQHPTNAKNIAASKLVPRNNRTNNVVDSSQKENKCTNGRFDDKGLVLPKKLYNPCLDSPDKKNLHRELAFNQKIGISVLNQKSELQRAMERHKDKQALKEKEQTKSVTPLQKAIDERAQRMEKGRSEGEVESKNEVNSDSELAQVRAKLLAKQEMK